MINKKAEKVEKGHHLSFLEPKVMSLNVLFCSINKAITQKFN